MITTKRVAVAALCVLSCASCKKSEVEGADAAPPAAEAGAGALASTVTIPAGTLQAGSACDAVPRITTEELSATALHLGEYGIDAYPFPNDPAKAPVTNVTRDEAAAMCASAGKRLCTELEWERACKGGANQEYEYGNAYQAAACAQAVSRGAGSMGQRAQCVSSFGVRDMHGLVWEWT